MSPLAFIRNLWLMVDALQQLKYLSEAVQSRDIYTVLISQSDKKAVSFNSMSRNPGSDPFYNTTHEARCF